MADFEITNYLGVIVAASQNGCGVNLFACGPRKRVPVMIAPDEARQLAEALIDLAELADRSYDFADSAVSTQERQETP